MKTVLWKIYSKDLFNRSKNYIRQILYIWGLVELHYKWSQKLLFQHCISSSYSPAVQDYQKMKFYHSGTWKCFTLESWENETYPAVCQEMLQKSFYACDDYLRNSLRLIGNRFGGKANSIKIPAVKEKPWVLIFRDEDMIQKPKQTSGPLYWRACPGQRRSLSSLHRYNMDCAVTPSWL